MKVFQRKDLKLLSSEDYEKEYAFANASIELMEQYELYEEGLADRPPSKFDDPKKH